MRASVPRPVLKTSPVLHALNTENVGLLPELRYRSFPPPKAALPEKMQPTRVRDPDSRQTPPPTPLEAVFDNTVQRVKVAVDEAKYSPPPSVPAVFDSTVQLVKVNVESVT